MKWVEKEKIWSFSNVESEVGDMKFLESELVRIFYLNSGNEIVSEKEISGNINSVDVEVREIFREVFQSNASALILAHNHPSGKAEATDKYIEFTEDLIELGEKLGLDVLDHAVVRKKVQSMRRSTELW